MTLTKIAEKLTEHERKRILLAAAQACEAAYRRGFQQGWFGAAHSAALRVDLHTWRFSAPPAKAPNPDGHNMKWSAIERFAAEPRQYDPFVNLGFERP